MNILAPVKCSPPDYKVSVVGAGIAGASCARALSAAGVSVHVVDKSRGAGGRLSTRRLEWLDPLGQRRSVKVDHGAPAFAASDPAFLQFLSAAAPPGALERWSPALAAGSRPLHDAGPLWLPAPDMASLCRGLLQDIPTTWSFAVDRLQRGPLGWQIEAAGAALPGHFDAVVLALPPAQDLRWDVARPEQGPLAWVMRNDARPGREPMADEAHWVVHARAGWSRQHLEQPADGVRREMQTALQEVLGEPIEWRHAVVHRWRYALPQHSGAASARQCWWDSVRGLGVCGDLLGGSGVEGAWQSTQALIEGLRRDLATPTTLPDAPLTDHRINRAAA